MPPAPDELLRAARDAATPLLVYQIVVSLFVAWSFVNAVADWFTFRRPRPAGPADSPDGGWPRLSVLIPARNEEATLGRCVRSLLAQDYPAEMEVLVLDDHSEDGTARVAADLARRDGRVRVLRGGPLLPGWKGKPNALRQLAGGAAGDLLLLTDADCVFYPGALAAAVRHRARTGADCLSLMPRYLCGTFWEHVILPLQHFIVFATLPVRSVYASTNPAFAAASGAFLLIDAATYRALGGHGAVRGELAEDIKWAQHVKRQGRRFVYGDGSRVYAVRMYDSLRGIWDGFSKNMFPSMGKSLPLLLVWSLFMLTTQILPFAFVLAAPASGAFTPAAFWLPFAHVLTALAIRAALALRMGEALWACLLHPLGWLVVLAIGVNSAYLTLSGRGHTWKGRVYET